MVAPLVRRDPLGCQKKHELLEVGVVVGKLFGVEAFVGMTAKPSSVNLSRIAICLRGTTGSWRYDRAVRSGPAPRECRRGKNIAGGKVFSHQRGSQCVAVLLRVPGHRADEPGSRGV